MHPLNISYIDCQYNGIVKEIHLRYIKIQIERIENEKPPIILFGIYRTDNFIEKNIYKKYTIGESVEGKILGFDERSEFLRLSIK